MHKQIISIIRSTISMILSVVILSSTLITSNAVNNTDNYNYNLSDYDVYNENHKDINAANGAIKLNIAACESSGNVTVNEDGSLTTLKDSEVTWKFNISQAAWYNIVVTYVPVISEAGFLGAIERSVLVNGNIPFDDAQYISFKRSYVDVTDEKNKDSEIFFLQDEKGDDIPFSQAEAAVKQTVFLQDPTGYITENLKFYFKAGENTIGLKGVEGGLTIYDLTLTSDDGVPEYEDYLKNNNYDGSKTSGKTVSIRAELPLYRTDYTIKPISDRSSAENHPISVKENRLNTIGGERWSTVGQGLTWEFDIKEDGWYKINLRCRQNVYQGAFSSRRLFVDGKIPFEEANNISFAFTDDWTSCNLGDNKNEYLFFFEKGTHTIKFDVVLGDMASLLKRISNVISALNDDYLGIFVYTGATPDEYRSYKFEELVPEIIKDFDVQRKELEDIIKKIEATSESMGDNIGILTRTKLLLKDLYKNPDLIATRFSELKDDISSLGTWVQTYCKQPLEIDTINIVPSQKEAPKSDLTFFEKIWFYISSFLASFSKDYESVDEQEDGIEVWTMSSSDQANIIKRMTSEDFEKNSNINVDVELVAAGTLLPSVLAGMAPDVALGLGGAEPIDYALRSAVIDLNRFDDSKEYFKNFYPSSLEPFSFNGKTYALPESHSFPVMFYRKDILKKLELSVPQTWDDIYAIIPTLQENNMEIGLAWNTALDMFLYQNGGKYYSDDLTETALYSNVAMSAFKDMTDLYTEYSFLVAFDFSNRFRNGEMPIAIVDYLSYNTLEVFAPEIKGRWSIGLVPGTRKEDGTIDRSVTSASSAAIILSNTKKPNESWEFLKWWTSSSAQVKYSQEMESILGASAKQAPSNINAISQMSWSAEMAEVINQQRSWTVAVPQIPGGYYLSRTLDFAFNSVYSGVSDSVSALEDNLPDLNAEIARKRKEFGL